MAAIERVHPATVSKWRHRFAEACLEGLVDAPRPGAERTISDDTIEAVVVDTLETVPSDATHWSTRDLAKKHGISKTTVAEIWRAFGLKPWKQDSFKISPDPDLIEKTRDIVGLYLNPPDAAVVFAVDEKPEIEALDRTAPILPLLPTTPQRANHDYVRNGTVDLFAALDVAGGTVITDLRSSHTTDDFVRFWNQINREVPDGLDVHLVLDNLSTHKTPKVHRWLLRHRRFHLHFTTTYSSWLNLVERWFSALTTKKLQRSTHRNIKELANDITAWVETWNQDPKPFVWHKTAEQILGSIARYRGLGHGPNKARRGLQQITLLRCHPNRHNNTASNNTGAILVNQQPEREHPPTSERHQPSRSLLSNAVAHIGGQARQSPGRGFATPLDGMAESRTQRVVMIWSSR